MPSAFDRFAQLIYQQCGTRLKSDKRNLLITRLRHRLRHHGFPEDDLGLEAYWEVVEREIKSPTTTPSKNSIIESPDGFLSGPGKTTPESSLEEIPAIIDAITTQETYFERTPAAFEWFSRDFLGRMISSEGTASIIESGPQQPKILIWSAACSIGAEVYSLAARLLADAHPALLGRIQLQGSDICRIAIERARDPAYSPRLAKGVDPDLRDRLFEPRQSDDGNYIVRRCLRERVHFFVHNLLDKPPLKNVDVVFLQNVLIYFDDTSKFRVLSQVCNAMRPGGFLVVGPSEGIYGLHPGLIRLETFLYQKPLQPKTPLSHSRLN